MEFRILGPLEVLDDGRDLTPARAKQRAVLAMLLLHANDVVAREQLIDALWGETPPPSAQTALHGHVSALRKLLGPERIETRTPGYLLRLSGDELDLARFEALVAEAPGQPDPETRGDRLRSALALWRGEPLGNLRYEPFAQSEIARLEELRLSAVEERVDADLDQGRHAEVVPELELLVAKHPFRERLRAQLMLALYRAGRQADALDVFQQGRKALVEQLGIDPGPALRQLESRILNQDEGLAVEGAAPPATPEPRTRLPLSSRIRPDGLRRVASGRRPLLLLGAGVAAGAIATGALLLRDEGAAVSVPANAVGIIDPRTNDVVGAIPVGPRPGAVAAGADSVWIANDDSKTLTRIDPVTRRVAATITLPATATGIAPGLGAVWVAHGRSGQLSRVDPQFDRVTKTLAVTGRALYFPNGTVDVGEGWVWAVFGNSTLARIDPRRVRVSKSGLAGEGPAGIVVADGSVWVANSGDSTVERLHPLAFEEGALHEYNVGRTPTGIAFGAGAIWVANTGDDSVTRIDPGTNAALPIRVGDEPTAVTVGGGSVWVANTSAGTISRIDLTKQRVVRTIDVGNAPGGIAYANGFLWVAVQAR
jgi:DNA-binding SARP family transcriptional activator/DNA-binding beta-propeller fold protein YncE